MNSRVIQFPNTNNTVLKNFRVINKGGVFYSQHRFLGFLWWDPIPDFFSAHSTLEDAISACQFQAERWMSNKASKSVVVWGGE